MAKTKRTAEHLQTVREILAKHDLNPIDALCREVTSEIRLTAEESQHPSVASLLGNYELLPANDGKGGWVLRPALNRRLETLRALAEFTFPRLRSVEARVQQDTSITWIMKSFVVEDGKPDKETPTNGRASLPPAVRESLELSDHQNGKANQS